MKKLVLMLMLVFGMTSVAGATFQISVNGQLNPPELTLLMLSDTATLGIWTDADVPPNTAHDMVLIVETYSGDISGGVRLNPNDSLSSIIYLASEYATGLPEDWDGGVFSTISRDNPIPAMTTLFNEILFHQEGIGSEVVTLAGIDEDWNYTGDIYDQVIICEFPEPATLFLLGLGAGVLRVTSDWPRATCSPRCTDFKKI
jgi:hypothetical protein